MSGNSNQSTLSEAARQRILAYFQGGWAKQLDVEQMFALINGMLPLEACLYYQVLPLFLDGNRLYLGMVTPNDTSALEYVRRIVSYINYSLVPRAITYEALQIALTTYLNFTGTAKQSDQVKPHELFSYGHHRHTAQERSERVDPTTRPTLILDNLEELKELEATIDTKQPHEPAPCVSSPVSPPPPPTGNFGSSLDTAADKSRALPPEPPTVPIATHNIPVLAVQGNHLSSAVEVLLALPAPIMLQELLARVLVGGIGRLYFECHSQYGRILWSQDGVLQSVFDRLPESTFNQLLDELKQFAELPPVPIAQLRQVDVERLYEGSRVLLRFRFMPGKHGEEATLQVLRGAALRFQQRQQLSKLKRDALGIARQLQIKLNEIRDRANADLELADTSDQSLPALNQLLQTIEQQLDTLGDERNEAL